MERYRKLLRSFYTTHQVLVQEVEAMIKKYVDAPQAIASQASREMGSNTPYFLRSSQQV
jgi:hypothetical protein